MKSLVESSPVVAGHRGFKSKYTENTIYGFEKCFETGATLIETDLYLTRDNVLVVSHDVNTKRIFCDKDGNPTDTNIVDANYDDIKDYKTIETGEPLLTFPDILNWFVGYIEEKDSDDHRFMLDIKRKNPPKLLKYVMEDLLSVHDDLGWWFHRIQIGVWDLNFVKYLNQETYFQDVFKNTENKLGFTQFDLLHISLDWRDSLHYISYNDYLDVLHRNDDFYKLKITGVSIIYIATWSKDFLTTFVPILKAHDLKLYSWTVNSYLQFDYLINLGKMAKLREYGIITDSPDVMMKYLNSSNPVSPSWSNESQTTVSDEYLVSELTKLTEPQEVGDIALTWQQKVAHFLFTAFHKIARTKRVYEDELNFASKVDGDVIRTIPINKFFMFVFQTCQKFGIF